MLIHGFLCSNRYLHITKTLLTCVRRRVEQCEDPRKKKKGKKKNIVQGDTVRTCDQCN